MPRGRPHGPVTKENSSKNDLKTKKGSGKNRSLFNNPKSSEKLEIKV
jgi:hypothetical protein